MRTIQLKKKKGNEKSEDCPSNLKHLRRIFLHNHKNANGSDFRPDQSGAHVGTRKKMIKVQEK